MDEYFYVTAYDSAMKKYVVVSGPYDSHDKAEEAKPAAVRWANKIDPKAPWYAYGITRTAVDIGPSAYTRLHERQTK